MKSEIRDLSSQASPDGYQETVYGDRAQLTEVDGQAKVLTSLAYRRPSKAYRHDADSSLRAELAAQVLADVMGGRYREILPSAEPAVLPDPKGRHYGLMTTPSDGLPGLLDSYLETYPNDLQLKADVRAGALFDSLAGQQARGHDGYLLERHSGRGQLRLVGNGLAFPDRDDYHTSGAILQDRVASGAMGPAPLLDREQSTAEIEDALDPSGLSDVVGTVGVGLELLAGPSGPSPEDNPAALNETERAALERVISSGYLEWIEDFLGGERARVFRRRLLRLLDVGIEQAPEGPTSELADFSRKDLPSIANGWEKAEQVYTAPRALAPESSGISPAADGRPMLSPLGKGHVTGAGERLGADNPANWEMTTPSAEAPRVELSLAAAADEH